MRYFTLLTLLCITVSLSAQIRRGDRLLSLNAGAIDGQLGRTGALGSLTYYGDRDRGVLTSGLSYGFALTDNLVLGGGIGAYVTLGNFSGHGFAVSPYLRYYAINRGNLMAFGQVSTGATGSHEEELRVADDFRVGAGVQLPLTSGVLLTPQMSYQFGETPGSFATSLGLELMLGRNLREEAPVPDFDRGSIVIGGHSVNLLLFENNSTASVQLGGSYFLTSRLAVGTSVTLRNTYFGEGFADPFSERRSNTLTYGLALGGRYYLTTARRLVWYSETGGGWQGNNQRGRDGGDDVTDIIATRTYNLYVGVGAQYFLRSDVALELAPRFSRQFERTEFEFTQMSDPFFFEIKENASIIALNFGIQVFLR